MDTAVALVSAYLQLNGYFVRTEVPVVERTDDPPPRFRQRTDVDVLAVRFPASSHREPPSERERWAGIVALDPALEVPEETTDVIIGEVKEGTSQLNEHLRSVDVLRAALWHAGGCEPEDLDRVAGELHESGEAEAVHCHGGTQRFRLVAFGGTRPDEPPADHTVFPLADVLAFLRDTIGEHHELFRVVDFKDPAMGMLALLDKLDHHP